MVFERNNASRFFICSIRSPISKLLEICFSSSSICEMVPFILIRVIVSFCYVVTHKLVVCVERCFIIISRFDCENENAIGDELIFFKSFAKDI